VTTLAPEERVALAEEIARQVVAMQSPVISDKLAMAMTGKTTKQSFLLWRNKYAKAAGVGKGRYSRDKIVQGLRREALAVAPRRSRAAVG